MLNVNTHYINYASIAILAALFAAVANILARLLLDGLRAKNIVGVNFLTTAVTLVVFSPLFYYFKPSLKSVLLLILIALIDTLANYFYFKTFEKTEAGIATPILSLSPAVTFLLGWLLLDDKVSGGTLVLSLSIVGLIVWFSIDRKTFRQFRFDTLLPALSAAILFGISAIPAKELLTNEAAINSPTLYMYRAALIALFSLIFFRFEISKISFRQYKLIFIRGLFAIAQWLLLYYALSMGNAGVTVTLGNITPIFVFILAALFLSERITTKKVVTAIAVLILSLLI